VQNQNAIAWIDLPDIPLQPDCMNQLLPLRRQLPDLRQIGQRWRLWRDGDRFGSSAQKQQSRHYQAAISIQPPTNAGENSNPHDNALNCEESGHPSQAVANI
jgi:hypothetical protein